MGKIRNNLYKIPPEIKYFAGGKFRISDGETFVITEDHTIDDILRFLIDESGDNGVEIKTMLDLLMRNNSIVNSKKCVIK